MHALLAKIAGTVFTETVIRWLVRRSLKYSIAYAEAYAKKTENDADDKAVLVMREIYDAWEAKNPE